MSAMGPLLIFKTVTYFFMKIVCTNIKALSGADIEVMFQQCPTKVKVTLKRLKFKSIISCPFLILKTVTDFLMKFCTNT